MKGSSPFPVLKGRRVGTGDTPFPVLGGKTPDSDNPNESTDAQGTPGSNDPVWNLPHRTGMVLDRKTDKKFPLRTPVYTRRQILTGISGFLSYEGLTNEAPMIPLPIRSSLAQRIHNQKVQLSHYISWIKPYGMKRKYPFPGTYETGDYPTAKVSTIINTSPANRQVAPRPRINRAGTSPAQPRVGSRGSSAYAMGTPQRFKKALPAALVTFNPPVYGEGN
jgi:hypothetical protein